MVGATERAKELKGSRWALNGDASSSKKRKEDESDNDAGWDRDAEDAKSAALLKAYDNNVNNDGSDDNPPAKRRRVSIGPMRPTSLIKDESVDDDSDDSHDSTGPKSKRQPATKKAGVRKAMAKKVQPKSTTAKKAGVRKPRTKKVQSKSKTPKKFTCLVPDPFKGEGEVCGHKFVDKSKLSRHETLKHADPIQYHHCAVEDCGWGPKIERGEWTNHYKEMHLDEKKKEDTKRRDDEHVHITYATRCHPICPADGGCRYVPGLINVPPTFSLQPVVDQIPGAQPCAHCVRLATLKGQTQTTDQGADHRCWPDDCSCSGCEKADQ